MTRKKFPRKGSKTSSTGFGGSGALAQVGAPFFLYGRDNGSRNSIRSWLAALLQLLLVILPARVRSGAQGFFMRRANRSVRAITADKTRLRGKFPGANVRGGFLHNFLCFVQLLRIAGGYLDQVVLQVVEDQLHGVPFENFSCRKRIKTELQIFFGIRVLFWFACLVVDDFHVVAAQGIHLVHPAGDDYVVLQWKFESLLLFPDLWRRFDHRRVKCAQLLDSVSLVFRFLILVLKTGGPPFHFKKPLHIFGWQLVSFAQFGEEALDRAVHDAADT